MVLFKERVLKVGWFRRKFYIKGDINNMIKRCYMIYMLAFWIILIGFIIIYFTSKLFKIHKLSKFLDREGALLFFVLLMPIIFIAITTKDPIQFGNFEIPTELQWLGSLFASFFGAWQFYLKPLKNKVFGMDREIGEIKISVEKVEKNMDKITDILLNGKIRKSK